MAKKKVAVRVLSYLRLRKVRSGDVERHIDAALDPKRPEQVGHETLKTTDGPVHVLYAGTGTAAEIERALQLRMQEDGVAKGTRADYEFSEWAEEES